MLLALGSSDVSGRVGAPVALSEFLVGAASCKGKSLQPIEKIAPRRLIKPRFNISGRIRETNRHAAEFVHDVAEPDKVDLDVVVNRYAEGFNNGCDEAICAPVIRGINAITATGSGNFEPEISRQAHQCGTTITFAAQHHDRVGTPPTHHTGVTNYAKVWVVCADALSGIRTNQQVILGGQVNWVVENVAVLIDEVAICVNRACEQASETVDAFNFGDSVVGRSGETDYCRDRNDEGHHQHCWDR